MANSHVLITSQTLGSSTPSVTLNNFGGYRDLQIVIDGTQTANTSLYVRFNSDSASNYAWVRMFGDGSTPGSSYNASSTFVYPGDIGPGKSNVMINVMDYSATDKHKVVLSRSNIPGNYVFQTTSRWANTSAITSITISGSSNIETGFSFYLYGVIA
jgi:hypothetical protein